MNPIIKVLFASIIKPFYRKNAGLILFFIFMMTLAIGRANGVGLIEYHLTLMKGILLSTSFLLVVSIAWLIYAIHCLRFFVLTIRNPEFSYLFLLSVTKKGTLYAGLLLMQIMIFAPVLTYAAVMINVGYKNGWIPGANFTLIFCLVVCLVFAAIYQLLLHYSKNFETSNKTSIISLKGSRYYFNFLFRFVTENEKIMLLAIKIYSCFTLYFVLDRDPKSHQPLQMEILFFSVALLAHGLLIHKIKEAEYQSLSFYRTLPFSLTNRFVQYAIFYFVIFVPELIIIVMRTPHQLKWTEAINLAFFGYGLLVVLNSIQLFGYRKLAGYLRLITQLFFLIVFAVIADLQWLLAIALLPAGILIFFRMYYRFDPATLSSTVDHIPQ